jgi:hypothetical protein
MKSIERLRLIKGFDKIKQSKVKIINFSRRERKTTKDPLLSATGRIKSGYILK